MADLAALIERLPERHRNALEWFDRNAGTIQSWPAPLDDGTLLATKAKGIYKPQWSKYALSIRHSVDSPYKNISIVNGPEGSWFYSYYQESQNPKDRDASFTNRGLMACWQDKVPVGVLVQVSGRPHFKYRVQGLGLVTHWDNGYFYLQDIYNVSELHPHKPLAQIELLAANTEQQNSFDPSNEQDGRERIIASIVRRRGQIKFRRSLLEAYDGKCAVTDCAITEILEAAHITPYLGDATNCVSNGILLRSDIHTLFDLGLLSVDTQNMSILIAQKLKNHSEYNQFEGAKIRLPHHANLMPSVAALDQQRIWAGL